MNIQRASQRNVKDRQQRNRKKNTLQILSYAFSFFCSHTHTHTERERERERCMVYIMTASQTGRPCSLITRCISVCDSLLSFADCVRNLCASTPAIWRRCCDARLRLNAGSDRASGRPGRRRARARCWDIDHAFRSPPPSS